MQNDIYSDILNIYKNKLKKRKIRLNTYNFYKEIIKIALNNYNQMKLIDVLIFDIHLFNLNEEDYLKINFFKYKKYCKSETSYGDINIQNNEKMVISNKLLYLLFSKICDNIFISKCNDDFIFKIILTKKDIENIINNLNNNVSNKEKVYV